MLGIYDCVTEYFIRMMLPYFKEKARPFISEEYAFLKSVVVDIKNCDNYQLVVIGAGTLSYVDLSIDNNLKYAAIEPLSCFYIQKELLYTIERIPEITIIDQNFGDFSKTMLSSTNHVFAFIFNVYAYIDDGIVNLNKYICPGDIVFISTWNINSTKAESVRTEYFNKIYMSLEDFKNLPLQVTAKKLTNLDNIDINKINHYKFHERFKGEIADVLIIYC